MSDQRFFLALAIAMLCASLACLLAAAVWALAHS